MSLDLQQFKNLIERTLRDMDVALADPAAVNLLLGTAAQESAFGKYIKQKKGPAVGVFQMEPKTFEWLQVKYADRYPQIVGRGAPEMEWDLRLAIIMARLRYLAVPLDLPPQDNVHELAAYWKRHYNTPIGAGSVDEFITNWQRYGL